MRNRNYVKLFLVGILAVLIVTVVILSWVPPVSKDALVHHLAVPKLYLKHGGIYEIPEMGFSYYPANLDLLYFIPLYFGNDIIPKFIHFAFALLTAWLIFNYLGPRTDTVYALLGAIFFLSIPIIVKLSITAYVDLGLIFFSLGSLLLLFKWIERGFQLRFLILSAVLCGLAMGTKYNGLIIFFLLTLFVPFICSRYAPGGKATPFRAVRYGIIFLFVALVLFSPWMIRNYNWTHNPIYPLYNRWFNPPGTISKTILTRDALRSHDLDLFTYRSVIYHESWWEIALLPIRIFFQGKDGSHQYFDGKLNPFLLFLPIFAFYGIREGPRIVGREKKILLTFVVLFFGFTFFSSEVRVRYISPIIPPLVILSVFGAKKMIETAKGLPNQYTRRIGLAALFVFFALCLTVNAVYIWGQFKYVDPLSYLNGRLSRDEYISKYRGEYPAMQYINERLPGEASILFMFLGKRGYYSDRKYIVLGEKKLGPLVMKSRTPEEIREGLKALGVTHLFIYYHLFEKWIKDNFHGEKERLLIDFFRKYVKILYYKNGFGISVLETVS